MNMNTEKKKRIRLYDLERKIAYRFRNREILRAALTHPSSLSAPVKREAWSYETLEFFGDSILNFVVSEMIFKKHGKLSEGEMTKIRSMLVSSKSLAAEAEKIALGKYIVFGRGEEKTGGSHKESILSATFETLIAAIYLDSGITNARRFVERTFQKILDLLVESKSGDLYDKDAKSILQEMLHKKGRPLPEYSVVREEGPPHDKTFFVLLKVGKEPLSEGVGKSKKEAEKDAARRAIAAIIGSGDARGDEMKAEED